MVNLNNLKVGSKIKINYFGTESPLSYKVVFINKQNKAILILVDEIYKDIYGWSGDNENGKAHDCHLELDKNKTYWWVLFNQIKEIQTSKLNLE